MGKTVKEKKIGLTTKIFIALIAGAIFGIILCYLVDVDTDFLYLCGHSLYIGVVYLNDIPVNGNLPQIRRHVPGGYELHFFQY